MPLCPNHGFHLSGNNYYRLQIKPFYFHVRVSLITDVTSSVVGSDLQGCLAVRGAGEELRPCSVLVEAEANCTVRLSSS